jgi:hypothetical protein
MVADVRIGSKTCLIMDEVDGMSAGDRGGVGALNVLIKKTRVSVEPVTVKWSWGLTCRYLLFSSVMTGHCKR